MLRGGEVDGREPRNFLAGEERGNRLGFPHAQRLPESPLIASLEMITVEAAQPRNRQPQGAALCALFHAAGDCGVALLLL